MLPGLRAAYVAGWVDPGVNEPLDAMTTFVCTRVRDDGWAPRTMNSVLWSRAAALPLDRFRIS